MIKKILLSLILVAAGLPAVAADNIRGLPPLPTTNHYYCTPDKVRVTKMVTGIGFCSPCVAGEVPDGKSCEWLISQKGQKTVTAAAPQPPAQSSQGSGACPYDRATCETLAQQYAEEQARKRGDNLQKPVVDSVQKTASAAPPSDMVRTYNGKQVTRLFTPNTAPALMGAGLRGEAKANGIWNLPVEKLARFASYSADKVSGATEVACTPEFIRGKREFGYAQGTGELVNAGEPLTACPANVRVIRTADGVSIALTNGWGLADVQ